MSEGEGTRMSHDDQGNGVSVHGARGMIYNIPVSS